MIDCREAVRWLWEYLDNDSGVEDREGVEEHLDRCRRCCGEAEFAEALRNTLRSTPGPHLTGDVERHLVAFLDTLEEEAS